MVSSTTRATFASTMTIAAACSAGSGARGSPSTTGSVVLPDASVVSSDDGASPDTAPSGATGGDAGAAMSRTSAAGAHCGPAPTTLISKKELFSSATSVSAALDIAVNATDLFVAVNSNPDGVILRAPLAGGPPSATIAVNGSEQAMVLTQDSLIFAQSHYTGDGGWTGDIVRTRFDGGDRVVLFSGSIVSSTIFGPAGILATDGQNAYFAAQDGVRRAPLAGGTATMLTTHTGALALVGSQIVVADSSAEALFGVPAAGGPVTTLVAGLSGNLGPVISCGDSICFASEVEVPPSQSGIGAIQKLDPSGSLTSVSQGDALYVVYRLVFDGTEFFATMLADTSSGVLARVPADGGSAVVGGFGGSGLAIDDDCLYVAGVDLFGLYSVAKSNWNGAPTP